jgi:hypothetical protein
MIKEEFKHNDDTKWALKEFKRQGLSSLFHPVTNVVYQRLVQLFFQNMTFDCERPGVLSSHLDGCAIEVTSLNIAHALGCPLSVNLKKLGGMAPRYGSPPPGLTTLIMV